MITYTRQGDGTYLKAGAFASVPTAGVKIQIDDGKPFSGDYTLAQAEHIIEDAMSKGQMKKDVYKIIPIPEKAAKPAKEPKPPREKKVKEPKAPRVAKYDVQQFATIYKNTKSLDDVVKATGASRAYAHRALVKLGLYEKPVVEPKPEVTLSPEDETRVAELVAAGTTEAPVTRKAAIKQLRKEQRAARKAANAEPKAPRVLKYDVNQFAEIYKATGDVNQIVLQTGASKVYAIRALIKLGVYTKPVKAEKPAPVETPATPVVPATEAPAEAAKPKRAPKSKPQQEAPPVEAAPKAKKGKS